MLRLLITRLSAVVGMVAMGLGSGCIAASEYSEFEIEDPCGPDVIGLLVERDPEVQALYERSESEFAAAWFARVHCLAVGGDSDAQLDVGIVYRDGEYDIAQDHVEAARWFRRAAAQSNPWAQYNLGLLYENGRGVPRDNVLAHMWYDLAASRFDPDVSSRRRALERREVVASRLTADQLLQAQQLAQGWRD